MVLSMLKATSLPSGVVSKVGKSFLVTCSTKHRRDRRSTGRTKHKPIFSFLLAFHCFENSCRMKKRRSACSVAFLDSETEELCLLMTFSRR